MIDRKTVFVLGAGAHCSYGFPSGRALKQQVVDQVRRTSGAESPHSLLRIPGALGISAAEVQQERQQAFALALENSGQGSIDAFLNANRHQLGFETIGKAAIAQVLLERESTAGDTGDDWLGYLFEIMIDGIHDPAEFITRNSISFVTFNYDRFLESWLVRRMEHSFGISREDAIAHVLRLPIHHVYGSLGPFASAPNNQDDDWIRASRGIRTIFDAERFDKEIESSKRLLLSAEVVCLLGYGFHRENTQLLTLIECLKTANCAVSASRYEVMDREWERLTRSFGNAGVGISPSHYSHKCLAALRHLPIF